MTETNLVIRARQGDERAWYELITEHQQAVFRLAYLQLGNADEAEDIAQAVFIRAYKALDSFDSERPLRPWLLKIGSNLVSNRRRSVARYLNALKHLLIAEPEPVLKPAPPAGAGQDSAQALWQAVQHLSPTDQEIIYLRYFLELSVAETAQTLDVAPGTVKSRLSRALGRLKDVLESDFPELKPEI